MITPPVSCEIPCSCKEVGHHARLVVLTGGPGAGKTAVLEFVRKTLCEHIAILPEAASILFGGGFWRLESNSAKQAAQRAIYHVQDEMQGLVINEKKWALGLCDRGTLDGLAYWPGTEDDFFGSLKTEKEIELKKYIGVIHLKSPTLEMGYNHQNPIRTESAELATQIDQRIHHIWKSHPHYSCIESKNSFIEKVSEAVHLIRSFVPECCREHLKEIKK